MTLCYIHRERFGTVTGIGPARDTAARWNCKGACKCGAKTSLYGSLHTGRSSSGFEILGRTVEIVLTADGRGYLYDNGTVSVPCRGCGIRRYARRLHGKVNATKTCNSKCEGACGPACECACGGKNHGASVSL